MKLRACKSCGNHILNIDNNCPHCTSRSGTGKKVAFATLLGIAVMGCGSKDEDSASDTSEPSQEPTSEPTFEPEYGVAT